MPRQDLAVHAELGGDIGGRLFHTYNDAVHRGSASRLFGLGNERGFALLAKTAGEAVRGEPPDWRAGTDKHAATVFRNDQALTLQDLDRVADSHPGDAVVLDELCLGRKLLAFAQLSALNAIAKLIGDLPEDRPVASANTAPNAMRMTPSICPATTSAVPAHHGPAHDQRSFAAGAPSQPRGAALRGPSEAKDTMKRSNIPA